MPGIEKYVRETICHDILQTDASVLGTDFEIFLHAGHLHAILQFRYAVSLNVMLFTIYIIKRCRVSSILLSETRMAIYYSSFYP